MTEANLSRADMTGRNRGQSIRQHEGVERRKQFPKGTLTAKRNVKAELTIQVGKARRA